MTENNNLTRIADNGNKYLINSSKQLAFLSAALIASAEIWTTELTKNLLETKMAILLLILSVFFSILIYFFFGFIHIKYLKKIIDGNIPKNGFIIPVVVSGILQAITFLYALFLIIKIYLF